MKLAHLLDLDARFSTRLRVAERKSVLRSIAAFLAHSGDSWFWWLGLILLWWRGDEHWRHWASIVLISIIALALIVLPIKFFIRRQRPEGEWGALYRVTDPHSFPSGHAARAILIAVVTTGLGPNWLAAILWIWAPLVAMARVTMGVHYFSDVVAGTILGAIAGSIVLWFQLL